MNELVNETFALLKHEMLVALTRMRTKKIWCRIVLMVYMFQPWGATYGEIIVALLDLYSITMGYNMFHLINVNNPYEITNLDNLLVNFLHN